MQTINKNSASNLFYVILGMAFYTASCQTLETGGKVVDKSKGEIIVSAPGDQRTALPEGSKDTSLTKARERSEELVKENPKDISSLLGLAQLQLTQNRFAEAEETSRKALLLDIKNQTARKILAQIAMRRENYEMALIFLTAIGGDSSKDSDVHNMLGLIAMARGNNGEAMRQWKAALSLNSGDISVRMNMGVMYLKNRLLQQASTQFERILKIAPNHQDARLHLAIIESSRGKHAEAIEVYNSILAKDSENPLALYNLGVSQKSLNLYDDAISSLKRYIKASPEKNSKTDQAFAMIDEINNTKIAQGQKVDDDDLQKLASDLSTRKSSGRQDLSSTKSTPAQETKSIESIGESTVKAVATKNDTATPAPETPGTQDREIEALEKQLRAPSH